MKRRKTGKMPKGLAAYWRKKNKSSSKKTKKRKSPVAKKKRKSTKRRKSPSRRRRGGSGGSGSIFPALGLPSKSESMSIAGAGVYGWLETAAKTDTNHFLHKIPKPVPQLGFAGGVALAAYLVNRYAFKSPFLRAFANGTASVALYKMMGQPNGPGMFDQSAAIQGVPAYGIEGDMLDDDMMGALEAEGSYMGDDDEMGEGELVEGDEELPVL